MSQPQARWSLAALRTSRSHAPREGALQKLLQESREDVATAKLPPLPEMKGGKLPPLPAVAKAKVTRPAATTRPLTITAAEAEALEALREESLVRAAEAQEAAEAKAEAAAAESYLKQLAENDEGDALFTWFARKARKAKDHAESARADAYLKRANKSKAPVAQVDPMQVAIAAAAAAVGVAQPADAPSETAAPAVAFVDRLPKDLRPAAAALRASLDALSPQRRESVLAARDWGVRHLVRRLTES